MEEVANITKLGNMPAATDGGYMIVNTEWGGFNNTVCPSSSFYGICQHHNLFDTLADRPPLDTI